VASRKKTPGEAKKARFKKTVVRRQLADRDRAKKIGGLTDKRDDPDRIKKKTQRLTHGRRLPTASTVKKTTTAGGKVNPSKRGRR